MPKKISTITLHNSPDGSAISINSVSNIGTQLTDFVTASYRLRDPGSLRLSLAAGSDFMKGAAAATHFKDNQTIKITYDDASASYWRVVRAEIEHSGGQPTAITCWPYWTMLDRRAVRVQRAPNSFVDVTLALTGLTVAEALAVITGSSYNAPPYFQAGSVASAFSSSVVNIEANGESHLDLLWRLMDDLAIDNSGKPAEFEIEWNSGDSKFDINVKTAIGLTAGEESGGADPSLRPIDSPTGDAVENKGNRLRLRQTTGAKDYFNRIVPVSSTEEEPVTIGQCEWGVSSTSYSAGPNQTTINLRGEAFVNDIDIDASGGKYFGNDYVGFFEIVSVTDADSFVVSGQATNWTYPGRFATDSTGTELVYLELAEADSDNDVSERTVSFDIPPFPNWLNWPDRVGSSGLVSADLSDWSGGLPDGWEAVSITDGSTTTSPTISEVTDAQYVRYGTSSAKVVASEGLGIRAGLTLQPTARNPYYSCYVNLYVQTGRVRVTFIDGDGTEWPTGEEQAESNSRELRAISIGGMEPVNSGASPFTTFTAYLQIKALADNTVFYVDSATVTRTTYPIPYRPKMGLSEMWREAARYLSENGGSLSTYDAEAIDVTHFETGSYSEIELGSWVRIRDAFNGSSYDLTVDARVTELQEKEHPTDGRFQKFIKVSTERDTASSRLIGRRASANVPEAPPALSKGATTGAALSQSYFLGTYSAGEIVTGVNVPLRKAPAGMVISDAYIINAAAVSADGSDYLTVKLRNKTQNLDLGTIATSATGLTELAAHDLTLNNNASLVAFDDVLYAELTGAGSGAATTQMVMVLESGTVGPYTVPAADTLYYVNDAKQIRKATIDRTTGGWSSTLIRSFTSTSCLDFHVDQAAGYIFTIESNVSDNQRYLRRSDLLGNPSSIITTWTPANASFAPGPRFDLDRVNQRIIITMTDYTTSDRLEVRDYDGTLIQTGAVVRDATSVGSIGVDETGSYGMWLSKSGSNQYVYKYTIATNTATEIATVSTMTLQHPGNTICIDDGAGLMFFEDPQDDEIMTYPAPAGGSWSTITTGTGSTDFGMAIDRVYQHIYFGLGTYKIRRVDYDGTSNAVTVIDDTLQTTNIYFIDLGV